MATHDFHSVAAVLHPGFLLEWPQSGERIRGARHFSEMNANYSAKGRWQFDVQRLVACGKEAVSDVVVTDGGISARVITFFTIKDGVIYRITEYWPDSFEPAPWRAEWVETG